MNSIDSSQTSGGLISSQILHYGLYAMYSMVMIVVPIWDNQDAVRHHRNCAQFLAIGDSFKDFLDSSLVSSRMHHIGCWSQTNLTLLEKIVSCMFGETSPKYGNGTHSMIGWGRDRYRLPRMKDFISEISKKIGDGSNTGTCEPFDEYYIESFRNVGACALYEIEPFLHPLCRHVQKSNHMNFRYSKYNKVVLPIYTDEQKSPSPNLEEDANRRDINVISSPTSKKTQEQRNWRRRANLTRCEVLAEDLTKFIGKGDV